MNEDPSPPPPSPSPPVHVLKFGGTCLADAADIETMTEIVGARCQAAQPVLVVSAAAGITDLLVRATAETRADRATAEAWIRRISRRYRALALATLDDESLRTQYDESLRTELSELRRALQSLQQSEDEEAAARDEILATGERAMAPLVAGALLAAGERARPVDATSIIRTDGVHGDATVDWPATGKRIADWRRTELKTNDGLVPVVTGFLGQSGEGRTTTLGRGGSDLSAAVIARGLDADRIERWTDTNGLYTRDPKQYDDARRLDHIHFEQARLWTKAGRFGMHSRTLEPLARGKIPLRVRSIHNPDAPGTCIVPKRSPVHS